MPNNSLRITRRTALDTPSAILRLVALALWSYGLMLPYFLAFILRAPFYPQLIQLYCKGVLYIVRVNIEICGKIAHYRPALFVSNHSSYLDIMVLGSLIPAAFISKDDVRKWPVLGFILNFARPVYISRNPRKTKENLEAMVTHLKRWGALILFGEGTTTDGNRVAPFKTSFFTIAAENVAGRALQVQPVSLSYTRVSHIAMGVRFRPKVAWYGDMELAPHLWEFLKLGNVTAQVEFHEVINGEAVGNRKKLAETCHSVIQGGLERALTGRND